ncbi:MAG: excinuclease ABC subunit C [Candidatus Yanofskybacteria bacterium RIFCSPHIGHO2_01_FULL_43_42]|uniref:Excinuclease ABC subunit C n=1 Tax=Candidatus Yanofskybacteria bacterium RIFCSPLOWO2_01_FULL_43_22 TaxID=1802695 RepID=A0A1F8GF42_9BACT|nr:MAG: excinuclease ABC subunit C [Candidatus Yanofskybacteria bacterium RIFCSPHIGHO2_01_FULL_43_42]OGN12919.1 MAG: excinuclease ABC subunit C [Candidatus Yanofskybacteria bacterium RIFCSPHIGHO2_02_FULL_43_17]OGN24002.1 MAG: excinuclease ABC subunit C [Candidatus Yanofskybacteria bacterium RIFCSPLOWO2_01_FULL_43_22]
MFCVYILRSSSDKKLYVGYTNNLKRRLKEHSDGNNFSTKDRLPLELVYYEAYHNGEDAKERERFFKTGWGRQYIAKVLKNYFRSEKI